ncbi:putative F-box protein At3g16210 [Primulina tabacum]|uniref:putative F-box protein At3g16210 n=1 Tax=Primulina tabacum TaxID=48773 RepID=UPI003F59CD3D
MKKESAIVGDGDGDGCVLPDAIVEDILLRLHSKVLLKLRIVCKKWKSLISTSCFKRLHDEKLQNSPNILLLTGYSSNDYGLTTLSLTGDVLDQWNIPLPSAQNVDMLPSQWGPNNLVCFFVESNGFVVCNPCVRRIIYLPQPPYSETFGAYGFCYFPIRNHYVIINLSRRCEWQMITFSKSNEFERLRYGCWKPVLDSTCSQVTGSPGGAFANGVLYWIGLTHSRSQCLVCFDLYKEKFFTVSCGDQIEGTSSYSLHELNGYLHLMTEMRERDRIFRTRSYTLWKLDDVANQTWIKQHTINKLDWCFRPLLAGEDGEMLFRDGDCLVWFSQQDEVVRKIRRIPHLKHTLNLKLQTDVLFS